MDMREQKQADVLEILAEHGLHPIVDPMGDDHHTDAPLTCVDRVLGDKLAYFLGGIFCDVSHLGQEYFYRRMTSVDVWQRVVRALRIHGLKIVDRS